MPMLEPLKKITVSLSVKYFYYPHNSLKAKEEWTTQREAVLYDNDIDDLNMQSSVESLRMMLCMNTAFTSRDKNKYVKP